MKAQSERSQAKIHCLHYQISQITAYKILPDVGVWNTQTTHALKPATSYLSKELKKTDTFSLPHTMWSIYQYLQDPLSFSVTCSNAIYNIPSKDPTYTFEIIDHVPKIYNIYSTTEAIYAFIWARSTADFSSHSISHQFLCWNWIFQIYKEGEPNINFRHSQVLHTIHHIVQKWLLLFALLSSLWSLSEAFGSLKSTSSTVDLPCIYNTIMGPLRLCPLRFANDNFCILDLLSLTDQFSWCIRKV